MDKNYKFNSLKIDADDGVFDALFNAGSKQNINLSTYTTPEISDHKFYFNRTIRKVKLPNVKRIGNYVCLNCSRLEEINIPLTVESIGRDFIERTAIYNNEENWKDNLFYKDKWCLGYKKTDSTMINIPEGAIGISENAFAGATTIESVTIPSTIKAIPDSAFEGCSSLKSLTLSNSIKYIGRNAFYRCDIESLVIPDSVEEIQAMAFQFNENLKSISLPKNLKILELNAFGYCSRLTKITFRGTVAELNKIENFDWAFSYDVPATYIQCTDGQVQI